MAEVTLNRQPEGMPKIGDSLAYSTVQRNHCQRSAYNSGQRTIPI